MHTLDRIVAGFVWFAPAFDGFFRVALQIICICIYKLDTGFYGVCRGFSWFCGVLPGSPRWPCKK